MSFLYDDWIVLRLESTVKDVSARNREQRDEVDLLVKEVDEAELVALDGADMRTRLLRVSPAVTRCTESIVCNEIRIDSREGAVGTYEVRRVSLDQAAAVSSEGKIDTQSRAVLR